MYLSLSKVINKVIALLLIAVLGVIPFETMARTGDGDVEKLVEEAEAYFISNENRLALETYLSVLELDPTHYEALHQTSLLYNLIGNLFDDEDAQMDYYLKAKEVAERALEHHPDKAESHYVYSIAIGRINEDAGPRERVKGAAIIREHTEKALELNPEHAGAWHVLGVWHYKAANLNFTERTGVRMLGGLPRASNEEAEDAFKKAIELDDDVILFYLDFAKFYKVRNRDEEAIAVLEKALSIGPQMEGDEKYLKKSKELLTDLG